MNRVCLLLVLFLYSSCSFSQTPEQKGLQTINRQSAEGYIRYLANDLLEGREAGTRGGALAAEYIVSCLQISGISSLYDSYYQPFDLYARMQPGRLRFQYNADSIIQIKKVAHERLSLRNVLGVIEGKRKDEYIVVGAHYDHLGIDRTLSRDTIYNGADDNASGVSAVLQIARAFKATGQQPERTVIFAFWDGEEKGLLGSRYFVSVFPQIKNVKGYLNFDMIGRNNKEEQPTHVIYFYTDTCPVFGDWLKNDIVTYKLNLTPDYKPWDKPDTGSDNASFARAGVPVIWYHTDGHLDYHKPTDHADKINWDKVVDITKASFLNAWNLANEEY